MHSPEHNLSDKLEQQFAILNHELQTPITSLKASIELLQTGQLGELSESGQALLKLAADSTARLGYVIDDILAWYQLTQRAPTLVKRSCDAAQLLTQVIEDLRFCATERRIHLHMTAPTGIPLLADGNRLCQALLYLLHNAIKFSQPDRHVWLTATIMQQEQPNVALTPPYGLISVTDQGAGIPAHALDKIFHPFEQVDSSDAREHGGLGLGLAICAQIIQQHQGKLWVESVLNHGSTFHIALPLAE